MLALVGAIPTSRGGCRASFPAASAQRVNFVRTLMLEPKILFCDEIVSGSDVAIQAQVIQLLIDLQEGLGLNLIFISHDLRVVRYLCSRALVMHPGQIVEERPVESALEKPQNDYTRALLAANPHHSDPASAQG